MISLSSPLPALLPTLISIENNQICNLFHKFNIINPTNPTLAGVGAPGAMVPGYFVLSSRDFKN